MYLSFGVSLVVSLCIGFIDSLWDPYNLIAIAQLSYRVCNLFPINPSVVSAVFWIALFGAVLNESVVSLVAPDSFSTTKKFLIIFTTYIFAYIYAHIFSER